MILGNKPHTFILVFLLSLVLPGAALAARDYSRVIVVGDSLSDPGNAFIETGGVTLTPPYPPGVPDYPYARGGHHLTNGSTWIEQLATRLKVGNSVGPALRLPGKFSNYAIDRTRACSNSLLPSYIDLSEQVGKVVAQFGPLLPSNALYVVFVGSNDVRDTLFTFPETTQIGCALNSIAFNLGLLVQHGAQNFLVANVPDLSIVPAVASLGPGAQFVANLLSSSFNDGLELILQGAEAIPGVTVTRLDTFTLLQNIVGPPAAQGLNVTDPCISQVTGKACAPAKNYLFWDVIHPTKTGHTFLAEKAAENLGLN